MKITARQWLTTCAACGALVTAVAVAAPWAARRVVRHRIAASLTAAGWRVEEFRVRRVNLREAELAGIRISRGVRVSSARLRASYSLRGLIGGRLDQVLVDQVRVLVDIADGWGGLAEEIQALSRQRDGARGAAVADLRVRPLTLLVVRGDERWAVRLQEATLTADDRDLRILALGRGKEGLIRLEAKADPRTGASILRAEMPARSVAEFLRVIEVVEGAESEAWGTVICDLAWDCPAGASSGIVTWSGSAILRAGGGEMAFHDLSLQAEGIAGAAGDAAGVEGVLRIAELRSGDLTMQELESSFRVDADAVEATLSVKDAPWDAFSLRADVSGISAPAHGTPGPPPDPAAATGIAVPVEIRVEGPRWRSGDLACSAGALGFSVRLQPAENAWVPSRIELVLDNGELRHGATGVACDGVHGAMVLEADGGFEGRVSADAMHLGSCDMPPLELTVSGAADGFTGRLAWKRDDAEVLSFAGAWQAGTPPLNGSLDLTSAAWPSRRNDPILACLRDRTGWDVRQGRLVTHARVRRDDLAMASRARVLMQDLSLAWGDLRIEGLAGEVEIDDLLEGVAAPSQRVTIRRLVLPRAELGSGEMLFGIDPGWRWAPASFACLWGDGRISADSFDVDAADGHARATVEISGVQLSDVMRVLFGDGVTGEGRLDGRLPVSIRWLPNPGLTLGEGSVAASGAGRIRIRDPGIARRWAAQARGAGGGPVADDLRERLAVSLSDFEYSMLRLTLRPGPGGRPAGELDMAGKGAGSRGLPLRFTVRVAVQPPLE